MEITEALKQLNRCWFDSFNNKVELCGLPTLKDEYTDLLNKCENNADKARLEQAYLNHTKDLTFEGERLKASYLEMINKANPDYFVTLTFADNAVTEGYALKTMLEYRKQVNRKMYGGGAPDNKLVLLTFLERNSNDGIHFHLLVKEPDTNRGYDLKDEMKLHWKKMRFHGYATFKEGEWFKNIYNLDGIAKYIVKQTYGNNSPFIAECSNFYSGL
jgi:hypothetical protein